MKNKYEKYIKWLDLNNDSNIDLIDLALIMLSVIKLSNSNILINNAADIIIEIINSKSFESADADNLEEYELKILKETVKNGNKS